MKNLQANQPKGQSRNQFKGMSAWALQLALHLKEHGPKFYKELKSQGQLKEYCQRQADNALEVWQNLAERGVSQFEAQQIAKAQYIFPTNADMP